MSSNFGEIIKKLIPVFGGKPASGLPKPPPPHGAWIWRLLHVENTPNWVAKRQIRPPDWDAWFREGGENSAFFQITQQRSNISRYFFHTKMCIPFLLLIALTNCVHLLSTCLASKNGVLYSEGRAYKRVPELAASPQSTALHSTGNTSAEDSVNKNEVGHNSTRGIVSSLLFFPLNYCCTKSTFPTSYVDWGYKYKTSIVKRSLR